MSGFLNFNIFIIDINERCIRFGDESLHSCEVMLRDLEDSKRVNTAISSELQKKRIVRRRLNF